MKNIADTVALFRKLGSIVHLHKSVFKPTTKIQYLGVVIDSVAMKVQLTQDRKSSIESLVQVLLNKQSCSIRELAKVIGMIISSFPAVKHGPMHYRKLDKDKTTALKNSKGNFDQTMRLSQDACKELQWWNSAQ